MSNNRHARPSSGSDRAACAPQLDGYGRALPLASFVGPPETCMSENTVLPQRFSIGFSAGGVDWKFWVSRVFASFCQQTHCSTLLLSTDTQVSLPVPFLIGMVSRMPVGEPPTLSIQLANDAP